LAEQQIFLAGVARTAVASRISRLESFGPVAPPTPGPDGLDLADAAAEVWIYGVMLIENENAREIALTGPPITMIHDDELTPPETQSLTTPNNDTLSSRGWIDLDAGPMALDIPASKNRDVSYALWT
jgi:hypothetical protein